MTVYELHPLVTDWLANADTLLEAKDHQLHMLAHVTAAGADKTGSVRVTLDQCGMPIKVWIQPGTRLKGATVLTARLNEALAEANAVHRATLELFEQVLTASVETTVTDPGRMLHVTTAGGYAIKIVVTQDALRASDTEITDRITALARLCWLRDSANHADRLTAEAVAGGDDGVACRRQLRSQGMPTQQDVDAAYADHFGSLDRPI